MVIIIQYDDVGTVLAGIGLFIPARQDALGNLWFRDFGSSGHSEAPSFLIQRAEIAR